MVVKTHLYPNIKITPNTDYRGFIKVGGVSPLSNQGSTLTPARWPEASKNQEGPVNCLRYWPWGPMKKSHPFDTVYTEDEKDEAKGQ